jgi:hypothetical protein
VAGLLVIPVGIAAGFWLRYLGVLLPLLYEGAFWLVQDANGDFVNHSGNGDNPGGLAFGVAQLWFLFGVVGVLVGIGMRRRRRRR